MKNYETQAVICLDSELYRAARAHAVKPRASLVANGQLVAPAKTARLTFQGAEVLRSDLFCLGSVHTLPRVYRSLKSRLVIVSHGDEDSTVISAGNGQFWSPEQLANAVIQWLGGSCVKRIALKMCYGGGNRGGATRGAKEGLAAFASRFTVDPRNSFAYKFARVCGYAETITAQTGASDSSISVAFDEDSDDESTLRTMHEKVDGARQGHAYKIVLTPVRWASPKKPGAPRLSVLNAG